MTKRWAIAASVAGLAMLAATPTVTIRGYVGDSMCGTRDTSAACVRQCFASGMEPVLISQGHVYKIVNGARLKDFPGREVVVRGVLRKDTLTVSDVRAAAPKK